MVAVPGVTLREVSKAAVTLTSADALINPFEASSCAAPAVTPVSTPLALTVATFDAELLQATELVKSCVLPSW